MQGKKWKISAVCKAPRCRPVQTEMSSDNQSCGDSRGDEQTAALSSTARVILSARSILHTAWIGPLRLFSPIRFIFSSVPWSFVPHKDIGIDPVGGWPHFMPEHLKPTSGFIEVPLWLSICCWFFGGFFLFTPPFIQCDPERFCLFLPKTLFYWTFALGNVPQEAITVQQYCDHPCGAAAQRWEPFRLINQSVECQEGGKSTMDSIPLHCLLDWFANGDAKVRTRDLKGFKMSVSWAFWGVDWCSRLLCTSFYTILLLYWKPQKFEVVRNIEKTNQVGYENGKTLFCFW